MTEESKTQTSPISNGDNTAKVTFGGKEYTIQRLKAGKFYQALKVYMSMVKEVAPKTASANKGEETEINMDQMVTSMFESWPEKTAEFVALCCSDTKLEAENGVEAKTITKEFILDDAYPEEITDAFKTCLKLNKVSENLKNFVAPIGELGAGIFPAQQPNK